MKNSKSIGTVLLVLVIAAAMAAAAYVVRVTMEAREMYAKVNELSSVEITEEAVRESGSDMTPTEKETINWNIQNACSFMPDRLALPIDDGKYAVVDFPEGKEAPKAIMPTDDIISISLLCSVRIMPNDGSVPYGIKTIVNESGRVYITAGKQLSDNSAILFGCETGAAFKDKRVADMQALMDSVGVTKNVEYCLHGTKINPEALSGTVFSPYCVYYEDENRSIAFQPADMTLPIAGYNRAHRLGNWVVYSGVFNDEMANTDLFLIDTGDAVMKVVATDIETLYWFFDAEHLEELAYDEKVLGSDILNMLTENNVGSLQGLNFFVPQEMPQYNKEGMTEQVVSEDGTKPLAVRAGQHVWLELDGGSIDCHTRGGYAIQVDKGGELVISGHGKLINSNGKAVVLNEGTCYISGDIQMEANSGNYGIVNHGTMEISGNVEVSGVEDVKYMIDNGFHDKKSYERTERNFNGEAITPDLKIFSGHFVGSYIVLQNEEDGYVYVYGGTFENNEITEALIGNNGKVLEIVDGEFIFSDAVLRPGQTKPDVESKEKTFILGGNFKRASLPVSYTPSLLSLPKSVYEAETFRVAHGQVFVLNGTFSGVGKYYNFDLNEDIETPLTISDSAYFGLDKIKN